MIEFCPDLAAPKQQPVCAHNAAAQMAQPVVFANHFQKHSDLATKAAKPLIDHTLPPS
jgi:hypothetical protein